MLIDATAFFFFAEIWKQRLQDTSKPNERSCRIFLEKIVQIPYLWPLFLVCCVVKNFFFRILRKCRIFFSMNSKVKNFENFLLLNSLKKNSKIFYCWIHWKKFRKFFTVNFIEKKIRHIRRIRKQKILPQKKKEVTEGGKIRHDLSLLFDILAP